ncbi:MAG TPA: IS3 family transposase [Hyphomicrobiaceae bacterium]|nr:IS3 family transposase [Hyphomicrobiaceae bacterium]
MVEKKNLRSSVAERRRLIDESHRRLSVSRQCELLGLPRSTWYYEGRGETEVNLELMRRIDVQYTKTPFYGSRRMAEVLSVNRKRIQRLMRLMGIEAIYPKRRTTRPGAGHKIYPYLLRGVEITRPDQVWSTDITYIPLRHGFLYLVAIMDWWSRYVLSWRLSNTLDGRFCQEALDQALSVGRPEIFNSDQGSQFTAEAFTSRLTSRGIAISMDGRGRALDNVFIERLWRTVKYEEVYIKDYANGWEAERSLSSYFRFYCEERV